MDVLQRVQQHHCLGEYLKHFMYNLMTPWPLLLISKVRSSNLSNNLVCLHREELLAYGAGTILDSQQAVP